jgi:RNA polymerase sigma factor (sigma-70 family)
MVPQPHEAKPKTNDPARNGQILEELLIAHGPTLRRQASRHSQRPSDAEDALQDAAALFLQHYHGRLPALPYLLTTIKHCAWKLAKATSRKREQPAHSLIKADSDLDPFELFPDIGHKPETLAERHEEVECRRRAILALKPDQRRALLLFGAGLSYAEIAQLNGWTHTKVNRCISEGRAALRRETTG